ncbi:(DL)-glycerol-3-phosphatase 2-like isoform X2 [Daucus carota subsp. sativus]|uniref:(DL)-glycerol-3-phosphatase 2-like isoform X2 n=1 Tax=Daucus carota subsp. sativus TaxID=79200 RepID=UPI0007F03759|nr:PREDICTED: (DL)-glycerol-3-phosphatase 2-like isoform X2 [Daucus carota subsp. sativus]
MLHSLKDSIVCRLRNYEDSFCYRSGNDNFCCKQWEDQVNRCWRNLRFPRKSIHAPSQIHIGDPHHQKTTRCISPLNTIADNSATQSITHVIFDMDGLLLDTEKFYNEVQGMVLARYNKTFDWSVRAKMMGMKPIESARVFVEETGISDFLSAEEFLIEREETLRKLFPTTDLMPGASRLIRHLRANNVPICVATGSSKHHVKLKTQRHRELFSLMHHIVSGDDLEVKQGKPAPDIFLTAAKRFEGGPADPTKILVFEDAPLGVLAAKNAGMSVVMVPDPRLDSSYLNTADKVLKSLLDFQPADWGLPHFVDGIAKIA